MQHQWLKGLLAASAITLAAAVTFGAQDPASPQGDNPRAGAIRVDRLDAGYVPVRRPGADSRARASRRPASAANAHVPQRGGTDSRERVGSRTGWQTRRRPEERELHHPRGWRPAGAPTLLDRDHRGRNLQGGRERGRRAPDCPGPRAGTPGAASLPPRPLHVAWQQHPGSEQGARRTAGIREQAAAAAGRSRRHGVQPRHGVHNQPRGDRRSDRAVSGAERQDRVGTGDVLLGPSRGVRQREDTGQHPTRDRRGLRGAGSLDAAAARDRRAPDPEQRDAAEAEP